MGVPTRPAWWRELTLLGATYGLYTLTRNTLPTQVQQARDNALTLYHLEQRLRLAPERAVNAFAVAHHPLAVLSDYLYATAHFTVTLAVLVWVYAARAPAYRAARTILLWATLLGLVGFWLYPLAPPRFFPEAGFVDTVVRDGTWGSWGSETITSVSNQYAAMPSAHVAWSVWCAATVALLARRRAVRALIIGYPVVVLAVVLATANHWLADAAGGVAAVAGGVALWWSARLLATRGRRTRSDRDQLPWAPAVANGEGDAHANAAAVLAGTRTRDRPH